YVGSAGLTAMDGLAAGTRVQCYGEHSTSSDEFDVSYVEAGLGTLGSSDIVEGHVIERVGNAGADPVLTVRGYSINEEGTQANFNTDFTVNLSFAETSVIQRASITDYDTDDINVGQAVRVYGSLSDDTMTANTADSVVRRIFTTVSGLANAAPAGGVLSMDVTRIGRHEIEIFNFDIGAVTQMDPDAMLADIDGLSTADIENDTPVQVRGFFEPVDSASATDFAASSLSNFDDVAYGMRILYLPASDDALVSSSTTSIVLDTTDAITSKLDKPFFGSIDIPEVPDFTIEGNTSALIEVYMLIEEGEVSIFSVFSEFSAELQDRFNDGKRILRVNGTGEYDDGSNTISSSFVIIRLKE
ncbi:MAG: hypothetical protein HUU29_11205, partial [Planctomycetaceae bacterium]|nr:hypothetical protein [Planctomycetaceae bacterium]